MALERKARDPVRFGKVKAGGPDPDKEDEKKKEEEAKPEAEKKGAEKKDAEKKGAEKKGAEKKGAEKEKGPQKRKAEPKRKQAAKPKAGAEPKAKEKAKAAGAERGAKGPAAEKTKPAAKPAPEPAAPAGAPVGRVRVRASARFLRVAPRKARLVADQIRGMPIEEARSMLSFSSRSAARDLAKLLESAASNAENNHDLVADEMRIAEISVNEGPTMRRWRPRALGRATKIDKRTCHVELALEPEE